MAVPAVTTELPRVTGVHVQAERAAVEHRRADLDELEEPLVQAPASAAAFSTILCGPSRCWYGSEPLVLSWMRFDMIFTLATGLLGLGSFLLPTGAESGLAGEYRSTVRKLDLAAHTEVEH